MSENIKNEEVNEQEVKIPMYDITAPELDDTNYAKTLSDAFNNINSNFIQLANRDFVKGEQGTSVMIEEIDLSPETELYNALKTCIVDNEDSANNIISYTDKSGIEYTLSLWDNFNNNPGTLKMIYTIDENDKNNNKKYVSSLYYVFLDGRFANTHIGNIDPTEYTNINDLSCIVVYDENGFKKLSNAFPTIYYEIGVGLCWKLNGVGTGIPVQGIPGKAGENGKLYIVKSNETFSTDKSSVEVTHVYDNSYTEVDDFLQTADIEKSVKYPAIILCPNPDTTINGNLFYFGTIEVEVDEENNSKKIIAYSDYTNAINTYIDYENITNYFKNIDITNTNNLWLPGIFIPLESETADETSKPIQKAHLLSASSITNNEGDNTLKSDIILTPVKDINSVIDNDPYTNILVNKYLYIKVDETQLDLLITNDTLKTYFNSELTARNYILKYKLSKVVKSKNNINFAYSIGDNFENKSSMYIYDNTINSIESIKFIASTVINTESTYTIIDNENHYNIMPEEFEEKLNDSGEKNIGIYRWELNFKKDSFDPDELKTSTWYNEEAIDTRYYGNNNYEVTNNSYLKVFNVIFTTTMSPTLNDSYMWFNGLTINFPNDFYITKDDGTQSTIYGDIDGFNELNNNTDKILLGWDYNNSELFKFLRFIPVYEQSFDIEDDTLLNINYNVNITGDTKNPKKNLTVNGGINCEDFKAYNIAAAGEIKNIYTKDEIIGDAGLQLSKVEIANYDEEGNRIGEVETKYNNIINSDGIQTQNINVEHSVNFETLSNKDNTIKIDSYTSELSNAESPIKCDKIELSNIGKVNIDNNDLIINKLKNEFDSDFVDEMNFDGKNNISTYIAKNIPNINVNTPITAKNISFNITNNDNTEENQLYLKAEDLNNRFSKIDYSDFDNAIEFLNQKIYKDNQALKSKNVKVNGIYLPNPSILEPGYNEEANNYNKSFFFQCFGYTKYLQKKYSS